jgi:hypothetical protein
VKLVFGSRVAATQDGIASALKKIEVERVRYHTSLERTVASG